MSEHGFRIRPIDSGEAWFYCDAEELVWLLEPGETYEVERMPSRGTFDGRDER